jgi:RimJ/RimL family protein N-acetyltransferase
MERRALTVPRFTERLVLRPPSAENASAVQEALEESFASLHVWMDWATTLQSLEDTKAILDQARAKYESMEEFQVHAFLRDSGSFVLSAWLGARDWRVPKFEIGYWCRTSMLGKGYATEVVRELTAAAFAEMAANRVEIRCDSRNGRSRRVAELAGFHLEAELRCDARANDGSLRDTTVYVLLAQGFDPAAIVSGAAQPLADADPGGNPLVPGPPGCATIDGEVPESPGSIARGR